MMKYFRELLITLKSIDESLKKLSKCVVKNERMKNSYHKILENLGIAMFETQPLLDSYASEIKNRVDFG